jgi:membrane protein implicated in regulation of membrane protease activity
MTDAERLRRRRCLGLRIAAFFGVLLAAFNPWDWPIIAIGLAGAAFVLIVYWRDCRRSRGDSPQTGA